MKRRYGKAVYNIEVANPRHVQRGVKETYLDGKRLSSNVIRDLSDNKTHAVKVVMG
jgi:cellobiose phosphorylase